LTPREKAGGGRRGAPTRDPRRPKPQSSVDLPRVHVGGAVTTFVPLLTRDQIDRLPKRAREVVEYRKSGLSLNHIQGCPLGCAYCIRHTYGLWDQNQPRPLMTDAEAVEELVNHSYFTQHVSSVHLFILATEP